VLAWCWDAEKADVDMLEALKKQAGIIPHQAG
jgi:hypothetical protein